jgi:hypothetical protein
LQAALTNIDANLTRLMDFGVITQSKLATVPTIPLFK